LCVTIDIVGVLGVDLGHILWEDDGGVEPPDQLHVHEVLKHDEVGDVGDQILV
jgi:hypothetical protein